MSERLTNQELLEALEIAQGMRSMKLTAAIAELRERRCADLTDEERDVLRWMRAQAKRSDDGAPTVNTQRALALLDKLLNGAK